MNKKIIIFILFILIFLTNKVWAAPSNIIVRFNDTEYYIVKAKDDEIPKGFYKDKLSNTGVVIEAYKNGPLTIIKISDEFYNYRFIAVDENNENKPYNLHIQEIDGEKYYIIPYQISEYENSDDELNEYKTYIKDQIMSCYSSKTYGYEKKIVYGINSKGNLALFSYENDEYKLLENLEENDVVEHSNVIYIFAIILICILVYVNVKKNVKSQS